MSRSPAPSDPDAIRIAGLALLARREHSRVELGEKLARRGYEAGAVDAALDALAGEGLLSDRRFAEAYVDSRVARGFGPLRIREELRRRGIDGASRDAACPETGRRWDALACAARVRRFGEPPPEDFPERARQARFLTRRGFSPAQVAAALGGDPEAG